VRRPVGRLRQYLAVPRLVAHAGDLEVAARPGPVSHDPHVDPVGQIPQRIGEEDDRRFQALRLVGS
jgi:hypothetical protein